MFTYELDVEGGEDISLQLEEDKVALGPGGRTTVLLKASAEKQGMNPFVVTVEGENSKARVKGALVIVGEDVPPPREGRYFVGKGFAINEDESKGKLISLTLLKSGQEIDGRVGVGTTTFKAQGTLKNGEADLDLISPNGRREAVLVGGIDKFDNFLLFRGDLKTEDMTYEVSVVSSKRQAIRDVEVGRVQQARVGDVLVVDEEEEDIYVNPKRVERKKILNIIPYGKRRVVVDVVENGTIEEVIIEENSEVSVGESTITVGSLEEDIEITVE
tara:strand:- start:1760 stop:2578 length:819 start_codon:yes stop_codon:yes gene_type:complete